MRKLKMEEIEEFANRPDVKKVAVENLLMSMGTDLHDILGNLCLDAKSYKWNKQTIEAILDGIFVAAGSDKDTASATLVSRELLE